MSTIKTKKVQVGTDSTASNNFTIYTPGTPDGTVRIGNGNADSPTEVGRFDANGYAANNIQIGTDATSSNNFTIYQPATPDGTLRIGVGNADSPTEVARFDSGGYKETGSPMFIVTNSSNQYINDATTTKITLDQVLYDRTNNISDSKFTVPTGYAGIYYITANVRGDTQANTNLYITNMQIYLNGASINRSYQYLTGGQPRAVHHTLSFMVNLSEGDYLEMYLYSDTVNSGQTLVNSGVLYTQFSGYKIG